MIENKNLFPAGKRCTLFFNNLSVAYDDGIVEIRCRFPNYFV